MLSTTNTSYVTSPSSIQAFNAMNAFKPKSVETTQPEIQDISDGLDVNDSSNILKNQNLDEIKNIAQSMGEENISDDDIKYGLTYGRSVIADFSV